MVQSEKNKYHGLCSWVSIGEMNLKERLSEDLKTSLKSGDKLKVSVIRLLLSQIRNAEIKKLKALDDDGIIEVVYSAIKQRKESIEEYKKGNRPDLFEKEEAEQKILQTYLPPQLNEDEIRALVEEAVRQTGASEARDLGKVMGAMMPKVKGRADGKTVNQLVREKLTS